MKIIFNGIFNFHEKFHEKFLKFKNKVIYCFGVIFVTKTKPNVIFINTRANYSYFFQICKKSGLTLINS